MPKRLLNNKERAIVKVLYKTKAWMNTNDISREADMAWQTAKNHLEDLYEDGLVERDGGYYRLCFEELFPEKYEDKD